jgi:hypothetical protein
MPKIDFSKFLTAKPTQAPQSQLDMGGHRWAAATANEIEEANHIALLAQAKAQAKVWSTRAGAKLTQDNAWYHHGLLAKAEKRGNHDLIPELRANAQRAQAKANACKAKLARAEALGNHALAQATANGNGDLITLLARLRFDAKDAQDDAWAVHFERVQAEQDGNPGVIAAARANAKYHQAYADYHHGLCALGEKAAGEVARKAAAMQDLGRQIVATEDALKAAVKRCQATQDVRQQLQALTAAADQLAGLRTKVFNDLKLKPLPSAPPPAPGVQPTAPKPAGQPVALAMKPAVSGSSIPKFFSRHGL